jgi:Tfp pilus assembly protein PilV
MRAHRGVSLVEALVAVAVMAFGMLGIVGMQTTMRQNGDLSKQRAEGVRLAQEVIESQRAFSVMAAASGAVAYADIVAQPATAVPGVTSNTDFTRSVAVVDETNARAKTLRVDVTWSDRTGQNQAVRLNTTIAGVTPEVGASLGLPAFGDPTRAPSGRHAAIPAGAVDLGNGTSRFSPPGAGTTSWIFNNTNAVITQICVSAVCTDANALLLSGFVNFATGSSAPTPAMAENPPGPSAAIGVSVLQTAPVTATEPCYEYQDTLVVSYYCAVPIDVLIGNRWSGRSEVSVTPLATSIADASTSRFRVCRYTPVRSSHPAVGDIVNGKPFTNADHPLNYVDVTSALVNQNFLVIRAGNGTTAFDCPGDDTGTALINGNTWHHQPSI